MIYTLDSSFECSYFSVQTNFQTEV